MESVEHVELVAEVEVEEFFFEELPVEGFLEEEILAEAVVEIPLVGIPEALAVGILVEAVGILAELVEILEEPAVGIPAGVAVGIPAEVAVGIPVEPVGSLAELVGILEEAVGSSVAEEVGSADWPGSL